MKRMLIPIDFSPAAKNACQVAARLAEKTGYEILLYHVFTPMENPFIDNEELRSAYNIRARKNLIRRLVRIKKTVVAGCAGIKISTLLDNGPLIPGILRMVGLGGIDLIVMGTQGARGIKKAIIGSCAASLTKKTLVPVLIVPSGYKLESLSRVVFATDCQPSAIEAFTFMNKLIKPYSPAITVLHIFSDPSELGKEKSHFDVLRNSLATRFKKLKPDFQLVESLSVIQCIETIDKLIPYDMMVLVRKRKSVLQEIFIKSMTRNMALLTSRLLLVIPEDYK